MNRRRFSLALLLLVLSLVSARTQTSTDVETIVPQSDQVSELAARQELVRVLRKLGKIETAESELHRLLEIRPNDPVLLADLADIEAARGHFVRSRDLYRKALSKGANAAELRLRYARQSRSWGDFYLAEKELRARLIEHPTDIDAAFDLAGVLVAEQRYEAAGGEYRSLAKTPGTRSRALIGLATVRLLEKDFRAVLPYADAVLKTNSEQIEALNLRAEALLKLHRYDEAKEDFRRLTILRSGQISGWIGLGRAARAQKDEAGAEAYFRRAQEAGARNITTRYLLAGEHAGEGGRRGLKWSDLTVAELNTLAELCAGDGRLDSAIAFYQAALAKDPEYFPARMGLAQALASAHRYNESIDILIRLQDEFPSDAKINLSLARVLSWSRRYAEAIRAYRDLTTLNPADTVPRKEMARVATWSRQMNLAREVYAEMYTPPVDQQLIYALKRSGRDQVVLKELSGASENGKSPYEKYERVRQLVDAGRLPADSRPAVEDALVNLEPVYRLQKAIWLESNAKWLNWNKKFLQSASCYRELLALQPGNEEAWFDLAQVDAAQGLSLDSAANYRKLLELDPLNNLARQALEREENVRDRPALFSKYTYWDEDGIGRASDIERHHFQSGAEFVWNGQTMLRVGGDYWIESPGSAGQADAAGVTLGFRTVFNEYWRASAEWSHKEYFQSRFNATDTGQGDLTFNAWDYAHLTLQYARVDELHNQFGLEQGVQSDNVGFLLDSDLNHYVEVKSGVVWTHYTDDNQGVWLTLAPAFILHDDPHMLKLILRGDYRDTTHTSIFEFERSQLHNIIHPYWTPQDYFRGTVIVEWRHDLSRDFYTGGRQHYYALRLGGGFDSTGNKNILFEADWHYDFLPRWAFEVHGTLDRSPAWDGAAAYVNLVYRF
jgi:tetratricopeptide (TPR) repeat protein